MEAIECKLPRKFLDHQIRTGSSTFSPQVGGRGQDLEYKYVRLTSGHPVLHASPNGESDKEVHEVRGTVIPHSWRFAWFVINLSCVCSQPRVRYFDQSSACIDDQTGRCIRKGTVAAARCIR